MRVLNKKLMRNVRQSWGQSLAVAAVVMLGTAIYVAFASAHRDLLLTRDTYYEKYRFADFTLMLDQAPATAVFRVENFPGVREARGRIVEDVNLDIEGEDQPRIGRVISMPDRQGPTLNGLAMQTGRYFQSGTANEVILSKDFAVQNNLGPGDRIEASINGKKHSLQIIGTALSPEYVYMIRNAQEFLPKPERFGILWVSASFAEMAFDMESAVNDIVGVVAPGVNLEALLEELKDELDSYGVYATIKKEDQTSNMFLSSEIKGLEVSAKVTPAIFMGIAAVILLVLLNRMVRQERSQIGLLKAYGYANWGIAFHYIKFALILGFAGSTAGTLLGLLLANMMVRMYVEFFQFPLLRSRIYLDVILVAAGITVVSAGLGALMAASKAVRIQPAEAMRSETPRYGHHTIFERIPQLWRRLSFTWKMIIRNVGRYRFRAGFSIAGVAIAAALMIIGFFSMDSIRYLIEFQFNRLQQEDMRVTFAREMGRGAWHDMRHLKYVRQAEPLLQYPFEARRGWRKKDLAIIGLPRDAKLMALVNSEGEIIDVGEDGLVLTERLAKELGVVAGDAVVLKPLMGRLDKERAIRVSQVVQQYLGEAAYMNIDALSRLLDTSFAMNAALLRTERGRELALARELKDVPGIVGVEIKAETVQSIKDTMEQSMRISNVVLGLFSGVIAFAIIYNTTLVSLAERKRELASLRVMGFTQREVGRIVYNENILLSTVGLLVGLPLGLGLSRLLINAYDTEMFRMPFHIEPKTFVMACFWIAVFVALANLAARRKLHNLDMVEVLKERE